MFDWSDQSLVIGASLLISIVAAYVALEMASRTLQSYDRTSILLWITAGSLVLGGGTWAAHFIVMSAWTYPFPAFFRLPPMAAAWLVGVASSTAQFAILKQRRLPLVWQFGGILAFGSFMIPVHFLGILALGVSPFPRFDASLMTAAVLVSAAGNALGFLFFFRLRDLGGWPRVQRQLAAATVYGAALNGAHYLGMAATTFDKKSISSVTNGLEVHALGSAIAFDSVIFLALILLITLIERRAVTRAHGLDGSLEKARAALQYVTFNDPITALPNRLMFQDRLQQAVARCERSGEMLAVLYIKLDGFRPIDQIVDAPAEEMLRFVAGSLEEVSRLSDTVANVGSHHFAVIMESLVDAQPAIQVAERLANELRSRPGTETRSLTASIGITMFPGDGPVALIVRNASAAANDARSRGGNCYRFFEARMNDDAHAKTRWLEDLRLAVGRGELELYYQAKVQAVSGRFAGVEALLRWNHPLHGVVGPSIFIPLAEQFGLINELGSWVIIEACRQMKSWHREGLAIRVAINLSMHQLRRVGLATEITDALAAHGVAPGLLTCEVTESAAMDDTQATQQVFKDLQAAGVHLSIDDFGTGYSSLSYLRQLPVRQLKIDRSFVTDLTGGHQDALSIVRAIIDLAHALRLEVVAEGVENETQRQILLQLGCDKLQGYLFAKPMPAQKILTDWTDKRASRAQWVESVFQTH